MEVLILIIIGFVIIYRLNASQRKSGKVNGELQGN